MPDYTNYLNLKQPGGDEDALIQDINDNMTKIDQFASSVGGYTIMSSGTDFNTLKTRKNYLVGSITQMSHYPTDCGSSGFLHIDNYSTYIIQEFHGNLGSSHRFSYDSGTTWIEWVSYNMVKWLGNNTLANIQTAIVNYAANLPDGASKSIEFGISTSTGYFGATNYIGTLERISSSRLCVHVMCAMYTSQMIIGNYKDGTWYWDEVAKYSQITTLSSQKATLVQKTIEAGSSVSITFSAYATYAIFFCGYVETSRGLLVGTADAANIFYKTVSAASDITITSSGLTASFQNNGQYSVPLRMLLFSGTAT